MVEPLIVRGDAARAGLLTIEPGGVLNAIDGLGYAFLGLALLFAAPVFAGGRLHRSIRWLLLANGAAVVPVELTYFVDRAFLVLAGPLWGIAVPAVSVLLAIWFRRALRQAGARSFQSAVAAPAFGVDHVQRQGRPAEVDGAQARTGERVVELADAALGEHFDRAAR